MTSGSKVVCRTERTPKAWEMGQLYRIAASPNRNNSCRKCCQRSFTCDTSRLATKTKAIKVYGDEHMAVVVAVLAPAYVPPRRMIRETRVQISKKI